MQSSIKQKPFSGSREEDLDSTKTIYETMTIMCEVSEDETTQTFPVMLNCDALFYWSSQMKHLVTYEKAINGLQQ